MTQAGKADPRILSTNSLKKQPRKPSTYHTGQVPFGSEAWRTKPYRVWWAVRKEAQLPEDKMEPLKGSSTAVSSCGGRACMCLLSVSANVQSPPSPISIFVRSTEADFQEQTSKWVNEKD